MLVKVIFVSFPASSSLLNHFFIAKRNTTASLFCAFYYLIPFKFLQGIILKTPLQWPLTKGFSFSCWLRIENFPRNGAMGLFSFLTENGRGSLAVLAKEKLTYEVRNRYEKLVEAVYCSLILFICFT